MRVDPGLGTIQPAVGSQRFFKRWGAIGNLRSIWNSVVPVAQVDRWRNEEEGTFYGMSVASYGAANNYTAAALVAPTGQPGYPNTILEVQRINISWQVPAAVGQINVDFHVMSPETGYNPIATLNPVGIYRAGLSTQPAGGWGSATGFGGYTNTLSAQGTGYRLQLFTTSAPTVGYWFTVSSLVSQPFDPPLRFMQGRPCVVQWRYRHATVPFWLIVSFLYREYVTDEE